ncbi:Hopanoid C-2 methylase [bacterium HR36]|uniref:Fe-S oxidoreductase n=1 Tax=uncultured Planctomycetota bacterium TaxID=120965 RepID=H5SDF2_9BACT|nr:Fe-S oxidoreductase [uncultured Planctomycetota bacterium]GBD35121.1 Hopanoid C-2 methylase [bacterium HR36]
MMLCKRRKILLVQLPIPVLGGQTVRGNIPLAAGYLTLFARRSGLDEWYEIEILPPRETNTLGDAALLEAILARQPWAVGFSCYLWNVERSLWLAEKLKQREPEIRIIIGGPEITADNAWVLHHPAVDYAVIGEGEATFADLLRALLDSEEILQPIPGLLTRRPRMSGELPPWLPRAPLPTLDLVASPYLEGILDLAKEQTLLLETLRGCVFKCKFCYYPKTYDRLYFLSEDRLRAILQQARQAGVREVVLLDPTLNQRRDLADLLRLLAEMNADGQWTCFGELRAEGITDELARLLRQANFTEVEVGLQSVEPRAMRLMERNNNLRAFERGVLAMRQAGIRVKVDLIIGLPGDTPDSVRRSMDYLYRSGLYDDVQVFHLMVLPGTDFRREARSLGLRYQERPPYYVTRTPDLSLADMFTLMQEASDVFGLQWDDLPDLAFPQELLLARREKLVAAAAKHQPCDWFLIRLPQGASVAVPAQVSQPFTLWLSSDDFHRDREAVCDYLESVLQANPFISLTVVLEALTGPAALPGSVLRQVWATCLQRPTYLDRYFATQPGRLAGAKRLVVCLPEEHLPAPEDWLAEVEDLADLYTAALDQTHEPLPCPN